MGRLFAVVDVETSGLSARRHHVLQIGLVTIEADGRVVDEWSSLVRLERPWHRVGSRRVHGIRRRDLRRAPRAADVMAELARRIDGAVFTAHNAAFDAGFLERAAQRHHVTLRLRPRLCTLELSRTLDPDRRLTHGLLAVCGRYGIQLERHHDALADARATAAAVPHLLAARGLVDLPAGAIDLEALYAS